MTTYAFPSTLRPSSQQWALINFTAIHQSPFNGAISTLDRDGEHWAVGMSYSDISDSRRSELLAFLYKLNGAQHRFTMPDFSYVRQGSGGGTPVVSGASQTGKNLNISGGQLSTPLWLKAGDKISVAGLIHSVDTDTSVDSGGLATIVVSPRIFVAPTNGSAVEITTPINTFALKDRSLVVSTIPPAQSAVAFEAIGTL